MSLGAAVGPRAGAGTGAAAIAIQDLSVVFHTEAGDVHALDRVSLTVEAGQFISLLGPSGCGKSTLLRVVADLIAPSSGGVAVLGEEPGTARRRREFADLLDLDERQMLIASEGNPLPTHLLQPFNDRRVRYH